MRSSQSRKSVAMAGEMKLGSVQPFQSMKINVNEEEKTERNLIGDK
jgi:hypothetical protein